MVFQILISVPSSWFLKQEGTLGIMDTGKLKYVYPVTVSVKT